MRARIRFIITCLMAACLLASCGRPAVTETTAEETTAAATTTSAVIKRSPTPVPDLPPFEYEYTVAAPTVSKAEPGSRTRNVVFYRDGNPIDGKITVPEGKGPFKTIIISNGLYASLGRYSGKALRYSENNYAVIEFQFQNGANPPPDYSDPEYLGDFIYEQVLDLYAVIDSMTYFPEVDIGNIYLYGHSMGGLVCSYAGTYRQHEIKGLLLVDPSFYAAERMNFEHEETITTDIYPLISQCYIPSVIITGTAGSFGEDPHFFDEARAALPDVEYVVIEGANHRMDGDASNQVVDLSVEMMKMWDERVKGLEG
ncbi:MAG: alpha/beta hydrolase [Clostridiales bacterium]|nr:alpha/beta hydrolase [Clostridiales bacterium]